VASAASLPSLPPATDSEAELRLLERAQRALLARPDEAFSLADEDLRRYPDGVLREVAEVTAIDALVRTGRRSVAEARARRFRAVHPRSPHVARIDVILGAPN
jgi:outer membrane protein assembly factor BamD (BamD/ComL family)